MRGSLSRETCLVEYRNGCFGPRVIGCTGIRECEDRTLGIPFIIVCETLYRYGRGFLFLHMVGCEHGVLHSERGEITDAE